MMVHEAIKRSYGVTVAYMGKDTDQLYLWFNEDDYILLPDENSVEQAHKLVEIINNLRSAVVGYETALQSIGKTLLKSEE
jgi:hypothetical protein